MDSFDDLSQTMTDANQSRISGCSSFESSLESTTSEAVQPLPAITIQEIQQLADPQPAVSISPIIRRLISECGPKFSEQVNAAFDERFRTIATQMTELQQTMRKDVPRNNPSFENASIDMENTILLSTYVLPNLSIELAQLNHSQSYKKM